MRIVHEDNHQPARGKYTDAVVVDDANNKKYLYACNGAWVELTSEVVSSVCSDQLDTTSLPTC